MKTKKNRKLCNNKGIAMVSILIAVAFVSIIGSSLLYICYKNFQMKVLSVRSKENFYETDGALVEVTTALRNELSSKSNKPEEFETLIKYNATAGTYDISDVINDASVSYNSKNNPYTHKNDTFSIVSTGTATKSSAGSNTIYTLKGVSVEQKTDDKYVNKVKTDIRVTIQKSAAGNAKKKGVGDFSMLMDNSIEATSNQFPYVSIFGDAYFSSYEKDGYGYFPGDDTTGEQKYTKPGQYGKSGGAGPAVLLKNDSKINIIGDYCVVFGDLVLCDNSVFYVEKGNLVVYGDIIFENNAVLLCKGTIYQPEHVLPGRTAAPSFKVPAGHTVAQHLKYSSDESTKITDENYNSFCTTLMLNNQDLSDDGILPNILSDKLKLNYNSDSNSWGKEINNFSIFDKSKDAVHFTFETVNLYGTNRYAKMDGADTVNGEFNDTLIFLQKPVTFKQANMNATFISKNKVKFDVQHGAVLSKTGNDMFNYMTLTDKNDGRYNPSIHEVSGLTGLFGNSISGLTDSDVLRFGDLFIPNPNQKIDDMLKFSVNGGSGDPVYSQSVIFDNYVKDAQ